MATKIPRINVTFDEKTAGLLSRVARKEETSVSSVVRELTMEALSRREDLYLSRVAEKLDRVGAKTYDHDDVWQ